MTPSPLPTLLGRRYRLVSPIGEGSFARVYSAEDTETGEMLAIKVLHARFARPLRRRFMTEGLVMQKLQHPNIVRVHEVELSEPPYLVMDLVEGGNLGHRIRARRRLEPGETLTLGIQVLSGLAALHAEGIVHRDIKSENILLTSAGSPRLTDFGIAKWMDLRSLALTRMGARMGTRGFAAPEQEGDASQVGPGADLYAVAATLFHALAGRTPPPLWTLSAGDAPWKEVPAELHGVLYRCTRADPALRHRDTAELALALWNRFEELYHLPPPVEDHHRPEDFPPPSPLFEAGEPASLAN